MAVKKQSNEPKKDSKGRNLHDNEDQLKNGRYRYRYTDKYGERKALYSWKLVKTDKTPAGKKEDKSLREKIRDMERDTEDGIRTSEATKMSVYNLVMKYIDSKPKLATSTRENYIYIANKDMKISSFGKMKLVDVKKSDVKNFYAHLSRDKGYATGTIQLYQNVLYPAFQMAVDDLIIRVNPCKNCMKEYVRGSLSSTKYPLERDEQSALVKFVYNDTIYSRYYVMIAFMLSSGCRIGEVLGLTWNNIDFKNKCVLIDHQVIYKKKNGKTQHYIDLPKNKTVRTIHLQSDILAILDKYRRETFFMSKASGCELDGYTNFVFLNSECHLYTPNTIVRTFHGIRDAYNRDKEDDEVELPDFTPHTLRHTACTRYAENGMDVKVLQILMGHKNIAITMQVYNHVSAKRAEKEVEEVDSVLAV